MPAPVSHVSFIIFPIMHKQSSGTCVPTVKVSPTFLHGVVRKRVGAASCLSSRASSVCVVYLVAFELLVADVILDVFTQNISCNSSYGRGKKSEQKLKVANMIP